MSGVPMIAFLALSVFLFVVGAIGVVIRRNPIVVFMCIELMLNACNLAFLTFARYVPTSLANRVTTAASSGQMMVVFVMAVAAAEVAVGLGIIMAIFRLRQEIDVDEMSSLNG